MRCPLRFSNTIRLVAVRGEVHPCLRMLQSTAGEVASVAGHVPCRKAWDASGIPWMPEIFGRIPVRIIARVSYLYILLVQINITTVLVPRFGSASCGNGMVLTRSVSEGLGPASNVLWPK